MIARVESNEFTLKATQSGRTVTAECTWNLNESASPDKWYRTFDIVLNKVSASPSDVTKSTSSTFVGQHQISDRKTSDFLCASLKAAEVAEENSTAVLRLVLPAEDGYISRSDIFTVRFVDCEFADAVYDLTSPRQALQYRKVEEQLSDTELVGIVESAAGAIRIHGSNDDGSKSLSSVLSAMDAELINRLSFPWNMKKPTPQKKLALFDGRTSWENGEGVYTAAKNLDISLIVIDYPGHWLEGPDNAHLREAFIPVDITPNDGLPGRIVKAIQDHGVQVDGLISYADPFFPYVAKAAEMLGLPTPPPDALFVSTDKYKTRVAEGHHAYRVSSGEEAMKAVAKNDLQYPLVVKPCCGFGSEGVSRVDSQAGLEKAVGGIDPRRHGFDFVIEEYIDGPELDANLILWNGEVLLWEASDDFPSPADGKSKSSMTTFIELANILPSKLPAEELEMLKWSLHKSLQRLGFHTGFYHMEARIRNSRMHYEQRDDGLIDLAYRKDAPTKDPSSFLIEINVRPPGIQASFATACTYGVEYYSLQMLFALGDEERIRALTQPFLHGPQYWCEIVFVPLEKGGVYESDDCCEELKQRRPDLGSHISKSLCFWKRGDEVPDPTSGILMWVAYLLVFSRESREHLLKLAEEVRSELRYTIT